MYRPIRQLLLGAAFALCTIATLSHAQGMSRQRVTYPDNIGITGPPPIPPGLAAVVLERAAELGLADSQRVAIESIRRMQDSANRPWMLKLDSLRPTRMPAGGPNDLSPEQREEITERKTAITQVLESMRPLNESARQRTMDLLTPDQQKRAKDFEEDARKKSEEEGKRRARNRFSPGVDDGRIGGGRGRPPAG